MLLNNLFFKRFLKIFRRVIVAVKFKPPWAAGVHCSQLASQQIHLYHTWIMVDPFFAEIPEAGRWPVDPQEDVQLSKDRIWIDGCFDFSHHGMLQHFSAFTRNLPA